MKIFNLIVLVLLSATLCENSFAKKDPNTYLFEGLEYAQDGHFKKAKKSFDKLLTNKHYSEYVKFYLGTLQDVKNQTLNKKTAMYFFQGILYSLNTKYKVQRLDQ